MLNTHRISSHFIPISASWRSSPRIRFAGHGISTILTVLPISVSIEHFFDNPITYCFLRLRGFGTCIFDIQFGKECVWFVGIWREMVVRTFERRKKCNTVLGLDGRRMSEVLDSGRKMRMRSREWGTYKNRFFCDGRSSRSAFVIG